MAYTAYQNEKPTQNIAYPEFGINPSNNLYFYIDIMPFGMFRHCCATSSHNQYLQKTTFFLLITCVDYFPPLRDAAFSAA